MVDIIYGCRHDSAPLGMASFVLFNLFIAVIISKMQKEDEKIDLILEKIIALEKKLAEKEK